MGCIRVTLAVLGSLLFPAVSATFDYENVLDEDIAIIILIVITVIYFIITIILLLLALAVCCYYRRKSPQLEKKAPCQDSQFQRAPTPAKTHLPTIPEGPSTSRHSSVGADFKRRSHRRLMRPRSDEEELIDNPVETDTADASPVEDTHHNMQPVRKTPDPRRKKAAYPAEGQRETTSSTDTNDGYATPRLPGTVSPAQKSPELPKREPSRLTHKTRAVLSPLRNAPTSQRGNEATAQPSPAVSALAYDYHEETPVHRHPNQRVDSPRNVRRKHEAIGMTSITKTSSHLDLDTEIKTTPLPKKTCLDTSLVVGNPGFEEPSRVSLLELQRQLNSVSQHWYKIGLHVGIARSTLRAIERIDGKNNERKLHKMCQEWLKKEAGLTWDGVVETLRARELVNHMGEVADDIYKLVCQESTRSSRGTPNTSVSSKKSVTEL